MTCLDMKLNATLTNAGNLPFAEVDSVLTNGSLMLFEPAHPAIPQIGTSIPSIGYNLTVKSSVAQFPNIAARPAAVALAGQTATSWQITGAVNSNGLMTVSSWGTCPGVHVGDELWNAAGTIQLATFASDNAATGSPWLTPAAALTSATYTVKRGTRPVVWRYNAARNSSNTEVDFAYEWTPKGAIHIASGRTAMDANQITMSPAIPGAIKEYMFANPGHVYFMSSWHYLTRAALAAYTGPTLNLGRQDGSSYFFRESASVISTMSNYAMPVGARNTVGMTVEQMSNAYTGTALANAYGDFQPQLHLGVGQNNGAFGGTYAQNTSTSVIFYRMYIEDLTVSGRTFSQVKAKDDAAYAVAFGSGGRYAGDTFTAPSTLMP